MIVTALPKRYGSAFRPAVFRLGSVGAPRGADIEICAAGRYEPLGVKRIYASDAASVNVAPYVRRILAPVPLCDGAGIRVATGRTASCYLSAPGFSSEAVTLCSGREDAAPNTLLSAAPAAVTIAPGERDEMAVVSEDWVSGTVTVHHNGNTHHDTTLFEARMADGMLAAVVDVDAVLRLFSESAGSTPDEIREFTVRLNLMQAGYTGRVIERHYRISASRGGRRLAWLNRYGAVDYHTFPVADEFRSGGRVTRIETPAGYRTVATRAEQSLRLLSEPCDASTAEWLSEIFSSPAVWLVDGTHYEPIEVAEGEVVCSPLQPGVVSVVISPGQTNISQNL